MARITIVVVVAGLAALVLSGPAHGQVKVDPLTGKVVGVEEPAEDEVVQAEAAGGADLVEASELVRKQKYDKAEELLAGLREDHPDDAALLLMLGEVRIALGDPDGAREPLERATMLAPELERANFQLATVLLNAGEQEAAIDAFGREIENTEDPAILEMARKNRVVLFQRADDFEAAAAELTALSELVPDQQEVWGELATVWLQAGDLDAARDALERGAAAGFQSAQHWYSLGARLFRAKRFEEAETAFSEALSIDPSFARAERSLGATLDKLGRADEAVVHLRKYLELQPDAKDADSVRRQIEAAGG